MELLEINDKVYKIPNNVMKAFEDMSDYIKDLEEENRQTKLLKERYQLEKEAYKSRIDKAIEYIGNGNIGIPRKTREKFIKILKGER